MMSVAFVVPEMLPVPPVQGGAVEGWVHEVSRALAARGFEVSVVSRPAGDGADRAPGVRYVGIPWSAAGLRWYERRRGWSRRHPLRPLVKAANVLEYGLAARHALAALRPDVVCVHNDPWLAWMLARDGRGATVLHMHNDHLCARGAQALLGHVVERCDAVLCVSDHVRDRAQQCHPRLAERFRTILNAIELPPAQAGEAAEPPGFLYVGRLTPEKGVHVLLEALEGLLRERPQARLTIAGSSFFAGAPRTAFERDLRRRAEALGDAVRFLGFVPRERLWGLYRAAQAVVVPSTWDEPFGLVAVEAMACGAAVIASRSGGLPEAVADGETGWLVPAGDARALQAAMRRACDEPAAVRRLGQRAQAVAADRFALPRLVDELAACLRGFAVERAARAELFPGAPLAPALHLDKDPR